MMRLDHNRALSQLAEKTGAHVTDIRRMTIWGNHSATQYPDISHAPWTASRRTRWSTQTWIEETFIPVVQQRGAAIIKARGASSAASAASAAIDHVHTWVHGTAEGDWVSMAVPADGSYGIPGGDLLLPGDRRNGEYQIVQGLSIDEFSRKRMDATDAELREERDGVKTCSARLSRSRRHALALMIGASSLCCFVAAVLFLAYRRLSLLAFTRRFTVAARRLHPPRRSAPGCGRDSLAAARRAVAAQPAAAAQGDHHAPVHEGLSKLLPSMSQTEREALEAGTVWWDGELFTGAPRLAKLLDTPAPPMLTAEEQAFLDGPCEELCRMLDDWNITHERATCRRRCGTS